MTTNWQYRPTHLLPVGARLDPGAWMTLSSFRLISRFSDLLEITADEETAARALKNTLNQQWIHRGVISQLGHNSVVSFHGEKSAAVRFYGFRLMDFLRFDRFLIRGDIVCRWNSGSFGWIIILTCRTIEPWIGYWERVLVSITSAGRYLRQSWGSISCRTQIKQTRWEDWSASGVILGFHYHGVSEGWVSRLSMLPRQSKKTLHRLSLHFACSLRSSWLSRIPSISAAHEDSGFTWDVWKRVRKMWFSSEWECQSALSLLFMCKCQWPRGVRMTFPISSRARWGTLRALTHTLRAKVRD